MNHFSGNFNYNKLSAGIKTFKKNKMKKITTLLVLLMLCCMSLLTSAQYVPPTHVDGAAPNGILWDSVLTGRTLPVRTTTPGFSGVPGAVMFYDKATGIVGIDPKGLSLNAVIPTYTAGNINTNANTPGPFIYPSGTGNGAYSPATGTPRTFPAPVLPLTGLTPTTHRARCAFTIGAPLSPSLATTGDANNIASTNGYLNLPWSFGKVVNLDSLIANNQALVDSNWKVVGQNSHPNANLLGYGPTSNFSLIKGCFQYSINGVSGTQVGPVIVYSSVPTCTAPTLSSSITNQSCSNLNDGAIDLTATGGSPAPTFAWSGPNSFTSTAEDISNLAPGTYTVIASSGTCTATASYTVNAGNPAQAASVSIASSAAGNTICAGTSVTFTATPTNGGTSPAYQWKLNGTNVGTNSDTYTTTSLVNSDAVTVVMTSNAVCATGSPATSNSITTTVNQATSSTSSVTACGSYTWSVNGQTYTQSGAYTSVINCATEILNLTILNIDTLTGIIPSPAVYPSPGDPRRGQSANVFGGTVRRYQCFYDSTLWTGQGVSGPIKITKLDFRSYAAVVANRSYSSVEIYLQQANVDFLSPSTTFANNRRSALGTPNYAGAITVNAGDSGVYVVQVPLTVPFTYDPTQGDLLVELVFLAAPTSSVPVSTNMECTFDPPSHKANAVRSTGTTTAATGSVSFFTPVIRTAYISRSVNASSCGAYNWNVNGQTYTQSGTYRGVNSCGDTLTLNLTVKSATTSSTTEIANGSFNWNGNTYITSGIYTWTGTNSVGCDSVATLNLTICTPTSSTETITACDSYTWKGTTYTSSNNTATWTGTNAAGCDSVVTLNLTITASTSNTTAISRCNSYTWSVNGQTYTQSGAYTSVSGCATEILNLTINQPTSSTVSETATGSYSWNGNSYTSSGTYTYQTINAVGCDSTATLNLTINAVVINNITNVCNYIGSNETLTYTSSVAGASSYAWSLPSNTQLISGQGTRSIVIKVLNGFGSQSNKQLRVTPAGGSLQIIYLAAQAPVTPATISASTANVCGSIGTNVPVIYKIPKVVESTSGNRTATSYLWTAQNGTTNITHPNGTGINDTTVAVTFNTNFSSSIITVQSVNACGVSGIRSYLITRNNPSVGVISGPTNSCEYIGNTGNVATYSVPAVTNIGSYAWTLPLGATDVSGQGTNTVSFKYPAGYIGGSISVIGINDCGTSSARTLSITRLLPGTPGNIDVINTQPCPNREYSYSLAAIPGNTTSLLWTIPSGGTLVSGQGTRSITVSYSDGVVDGAVTVKSVSNCGASSIRSLIVKLAPCSASPSPQYTKGIIATMPTALDVKVFPNPTTSSFDLRVTDGGSKSAIQARVFDLQGRMMKTIQLNPNENISLGAEFKPGVYMLEVLKGTEKKVLRLVKY